MEKLKEATEEFITVETFTESDAVHPRFIKEDSEFIKKYEKENYYFCAQCNLFFAPNYVGLWTHFTEEITEHQSCGSCFYCKGKVYEYSLNDESRVYHNCRDSTKNSGNS